MRALVVLFFVLTSPASARGVPEDDLLHLTVQFSRGIVPNSIRFGHDGFELGQLNESTWGLVHRWAVDWLTCGIGPGYGSNSFMDPEPGLYAEIGAHKQVYDWLDLRWDISQFVGISRNMRSEMLLGFGLHY